MESEGGAVKARRKSLARTELGLAPVFAALALLTAIWPTWIETLTHIDPDGGSGGTEWGIVLAFGALAVGAGVLGLRTYPAAASHGD